MLTSRQNQDIRKRRDRRYRTQQNPPGRETGGGTMTDDFHMLRDVRDEDTKHELSGHKEYQNLDGRCVDAEIITRRERGPSHSGRRDVRSMGRPSWRRECVLVAEEVLRIFDEFGG
jgi:hypothetical protein